MTSKRGAPRLWTVDETELLGPGVGFAVLREIDVGKMNRCVEISIGGARFWCRPELAALYVDGRGAPVGEPHDVRLILEARADELYAREARGLPC